MSKDKYVAYVSCYTNGKDPGIKIFDVDMKKGRFKEKGFVDVRNSSYVTISHNGKYLYSITDFGVEAFKILPDGGLEIINFAPVNGMRGCYLATDYTDRYLFVAGYHDGKLTILSLDDDGGIGAITDEIFHRTIGSVGEKNCRPHINCARMTHDNRFLLVADEGMDRVDIYSFDAEWGKATPYDVIRCEVDSAPRHIKISKDGRFIYVVHAWKCFVSVYEYLEKDGIVSFEKIQTINTVHGGSNGNAASALSFSSDYRYLISSNAGDNSVVVYEQNEEDGTLKEKFCLPISGEYPKDADFFPDTKFIVSLNHESNDMTFFSVDFEKNTIVMNGPSIRIYEPNCITFHKL